MLPADAAWRLLLAAGLGAALGLEREYRQKPAGLRTNILIALGSALFTIVSSLIGHEPGNTDRISAQIVTGIGFLGGGAILRSGTTIHGMTTAATIWVNAAIGMAAGAGHLGQSVVEAAGDGTPLDQREVVEIGEVLGFGNRGHATSPPSDATTMNGGDTHAPVIGTLESCR